MYCCTDFILIRPRACGGACLEAGYAGQDLAGHLQEGLAQALLHAQLRFWGFQTICQCTVIKGTEFLCTVTKKTFSRLLSYSFLQKIKIASIYSPKKHTFNTPYQKKNFSLHWPKITQPQKKQSFNTQSLKKQSFNTQAQKSKPFHYWHKRNKKCPKNFNTLS